MAIGSRYVTGGGVPNWGLLRRIISKGAGALAHFFSTLHPQGQGSYVRFVYV